MRDLSRAASAPRFLLLVGCLTTALLASGCGSGTSTVTFKVSLPDGSPLPFAKIHVQCLGGTNPVFPGDLRDGVFTVNNVPYGEIKVEIETIPPQEGQEEMPTNIKKMELPEKFKVEPGLYVPINPKYKNVATSGLVYQINKSQETIEIKLQPSLR